MGILGRFLGRRRPARRKKRVFLFLLGALVAVLAVTQCTPGAELDALMAPYGSTVPVTEQAAQDFFTKVARTAQQGAETQHVSLTVTEREATSALALSMEVVEVMQAMQTMSPEQVEALGPEELRSMAAARDLDASPRTVGERIAHALNPRVALRDAQVRFLEDGQLVVGGYVHAWRWRQPMLLVVAPRARSGSMDLDFVQGRLGRLPAPEWLFDRTGDLMSSVILMGQDYAEITELQVNAGRLTLQAATTR